MIRLISFKAKTNLDLTIWQILGVFDMQFYFNFNDFY